MKNKPYTDKMYRPEVQGPKKPGMPVTKPKPVPGFITPSPVGSKETSPMDRKNMAKKRALKMMLGNR